jgi:hypothetical protein
MIKVIFSMKTLKCFLSFQFKLYLQSTFATEEEHYEEHSQFLYYRSY